MHINKTLLYPSDLAVRHRLHGPISDYKSVGVLLRVIARNYRKFSQFHEIQTGG